MSPTTCSADEATVQALRRDVSLQLARLAQRMGMTQTAIAKQLGLPQPTLSKIANGRVSDVSLELLIRVAVRAGLALTLQTGRVPQEAGAFVSDTHPPSSRGTRSKLADEARRSLFRAEAALTPSQRLEAYLEHNQLLGVLQQAGRAAEARRVRAPEQ
jgi:predicted XRE-type DNA-binding protein